MAYELTVPADNAAVRAVLGVREALTANRTYYVATTGNNTNDGLSAGSPFLTGQAALDAIASRIDFNGFKVTLKFADGTYNGRILIPNMVGQKKTGDLELQGNLTTPTNVIIQNTTGFQSCIEANYGSMCTVSYMRLTAPNNGYGLNCAEGAVIDVQAGVDFGDCTGGYHMYALNAGTINCFGSYTISGKANAHYCSGLNGNLYSSGITVNAGGAALAFSFAFAGAFDGGIMQVNGITFSNVASITGSRYAAQRGASIVTFGAGASYLPGSVAGSASGGYYS